MGDKKKGKGQDEEKAKSGCIGKLLGLFVVVMLGGLAVALFFIYQAEDLTRIKGYGPAAKLKAGRDVLAVLNNAKERGYSVSVSEEELNGYISRTLVAKQGGMLGANVTFDGLWISLEEGRAEVIQERHILGHPFTVSMYIRLEQRLNGKGVPETELHRDGGPYLKDAPLPNVGGRFGQLVVPEGFMYLLLPSFAKLVTAFDGEIKTGFSEFGRVTIHQGHVQFDPHGGGLEMQTPRGSF